MKENKAEIYVADVRIFTEEINCLTFLLPLPWAHLSKDQLSKLYELVDEEGKTVLLVTNLVQATGIRDDLMCFALYKRLDELIYSVPQTFDGWVPVRPERSLRRKANYSHYTEEHRAKYAARIEAMESQIKKKDTKKTDVYSLAQYIAKKATELHSYISRESKQPVFWAITEAFEAFVSPAVLRSRCPENIAVSLIFKEYNYSPFNLSDLMTALMNRPMEKEIAKEKRDRSRSRSPKRTNK
jgi:hypothetical protein